MEIMKGKDLCAALIEGVERLQNERVRREGMSEINNPHILYLDFDGVLHSSDTWLPKDGRPPYCADGELFEWAPCLIDILKPYPHLRIILSTSWVHHLGFDAAVGYLPAPLQERVISATYYGPSGQYATHPLSRGEMVRIDAVRRGLDFREWVAIDDDADGWGDARHRLIVTKGAFGVSDPSTQDELRKMLIADSPSR